MDIEILMDHNGDHDCTMTTAYCTVWLKRTMPRPGVYMHKEHGSRHSYILVPNSVCTRACEHLGKFEGFGPLKIPGGPLKFNVLDF